jgi:hypothetical protein
MESEEGKNLIIAADMKELAYNELILLIDGKSSSTKVVYNFVKGCMNIYYVYGNASMASERLKNNFDPSCALSLVKLEKQFRQGSLKKGKDPDVWINEFEDNRMRLEEFLSSISDNRTGDYDL